MKKFQKLRSYFLRICRENAVKSGFSGTPARNGAKWVHFQRMSFLKDNICTENSLSNYEVKNDDVNTAENIFEASIYVKYTQTFSDIASFISFYSLPLLYSILNFELQIYCQFIYFTRRTV